MIEESGALTALAERGAATGIVLPRHRPVRHRLRLRALFFAGFCVLIGTLILRSRLIPRVIGALMVVAGGCYVVNTLALILSPACPTGSSPGDSAAYRAGLASSCRLGGLPRTDPRPHPHQPPPRTPPTTPPPSLAGWLALWLTVKGDRRTKPADCRRPPRTLAYRHNRCRPVRLPGDPQRGVPGQHVEVVVAVEQGRPSCGWRPRRSGSRSACGRSRRPPGSGGGARRRPRSRPGPRPAGAGSAGAAGAARPPRPGRPPRRAAPSSRPRWCQLALAGDQLPQAQVRRAAGGPRYRPRPRCRPGSQPGGGVTRRGGTRVGLTHASRSPLQPTPSMASASSRLISSPASRRRASSTAARLLGNR